MEEKNKMNLTLKELKSKYEKLREKYAKYNLPAFDEINQISGIEFICGDYETEVLSTRIRIQFYQNQISNPMQILSGYFLQPSPFLRISQVLKDKAGEIIKRLIPFQLKFTIGDFISTEDYDMKCIGESFEEIKKINKEIVKVLEELNEMKPNNTHEAGYLG